MTAPHIVQEALRSPGHQLDATTRAFMESRFGHDFSRVRVHTDAGAAQAAAAIGARAFTLGRDVVFAGGQFQPATRQTQRLLAHELTHVIQQGGSERAATVQAEFAIRPNQPATAEDLTEAQIQAAIQFNSGLLSNPLEVAQLRDILGVDAEPAVVDEAFVRAVARYQAQFDLTVNGQIDSPTRRQLSREILAEARGMGDAEMEEAITPTMQSTLGVFGLEGDDFGFNKKGRFQGRHALNPAKIRDIRRSLETERTQNLIRETLNILQSHADSFSGVTVDLPFAISLGVRESGVGNVFSNQETLINTAGRDTHPAGRSGMDYFYNLSEGFTSRGQEISRVTTGFQPGRTDRRPALIERRRLLLGFIIKTAADELTLKRFVRGELENLLGDEAQAAATSEQLFNDVSIDALRSWKALMFAGVGYGQSAVRTILRAQHAAGRSFSLDEILTLSSAPPNVDGARLDRARAVALGSLVIEGDIQ